ncbi:DUF4268 domain-containing protein [Nonlabens antarcticus]|uniref:DUF4268 domain-containing protein n=1 Tax=Nonlabens antarcticus TaxID=392714 RepID=UPI0018916ADC|nr:DUF4268 domain-containing protein [Nonlabens antarcticus]
MYTKEESKQIRQDFWTFFGKRYHRKWTLYDTKIRDVNLKFSMESTRAIVSIDMEHDDDLIRQYYFEKLISLKSVLKDAVSTEVIFDDCYELESGKVISRVYIYKELVKITRKTDWPETYAFFHENMDKLESFFWEYKDYIED